MILWGCRAEGLPGVLGYVDNFFDFEHELAEGLSPRETFAKIERLFAALDIPLHERMVGKKFKALGWMWDTSVEGAPLMVCADNKYAYLLQCLPVWASAAILPRADVESAIGFLHWISAAFPLGLPHIQYARHDVIKHMRSPKTTGVVLSPESRNGFAFWNKFMPTWDQRSRVFLDFGPMRHADVLWRFDASTDWGMGAFIWDLTANTGFYILHEWTENERDFAKGPVRESTGVFEAMAAVRCVRAFAGLSNGRRVLMEGDNEALAYGLRKCYSKNKKMLGMIQSVWESVCAAHAVLRTAHIVGAVYNTVADHLSHNRERAAILEAMRTLGVEFRRVPSHST